MGCLGRSPGAVHGHTAIPSPWYPNQFYVFGGRNKTKKPENEMYVLDTTKRQWTKMRTGGRMPVGRYGHAGCLSKSKFIVFGGSNNRGYCDETVFSLKLSPPPIIVDEEETIEPRRPASQSGGKKFGGITLPGLVAQIKDFRSKTTTAKPLSELMSTSVKPVAGSPAKTMPVRFCTCPDIFYISEGIVLIYLKIYIGWFLLEKKVEEKLVEKDQITCCIKRVKSDKRKNSNNILRIYTGRRQKEGTKSRQGASRGASIDRGQKA